MSRWGCMGAGGGIFWEGGHFLLVVGNRFGGGGLFWVGGVG